MIYRTRIIRDATQLRACEADWRRLWRNAPAATPFQSPGWLLPWWTVFAPGGLCVVACYRGEDLIGLAPLYVEVTPAKRRLLMLGIGISDYLDILVDPAFAEVASDRLAEALDDENGWDELELTELLPGAAAFGLRDLRSASADAGTASAAPVLMLPDRPEDLERALPPRKRRQVRMSMHRAERRGSTEFIVADRETFPPLWSALTALHSAEWTQRGQPGVLADPLVQAFHRAAAPRLIAAGVAQLTALRINGDIAAVYYGFIDRGRAYAYLGGYDMNYRFESPGTLLLAQMLAEAIKHGAREFHFLRGDEPYKYAWGAQRRTNQRHVFCRAKLELASA